MEDNLRETLGLDQDVVSCFGWGQHHDALVPSPETLREGCTVVICTYKRAASLLRFLDSLLLQEKKPDRLVIVDASPDDAAEQGVRNYFAADALADSVLYFRVSGSLRGLTHQRNFALKWVATDLVVSFDDDIVLLPHCLEEMENALRIKGDVVGVGAYSMNEWQRPPMMWRHRRLLRVVPNLQPGAYHRCGLPVPWSFLPPTEKIVEGKWLRGCAMMWKTAPARKVGFNEQFNGYSSGEDLDFSLRMAPWGKIVVAGKARVLHLHDQSGRPNAYMLGYTGILNSYSTHRRCLPNRTRKDVARFFYAYGIDALMRIANLPVPGDTMSRLQFLKGRLRFLTELLRGEPLQGERSQTDSA